MRGVFVYNFKLVSTTSLFLSKIVSYPIILYIKNNRKIEMLRVYLSPYTQEWNIGVGDFGDEEERMNPH